LVLIRDNFMKEITFITGNQKKADYLAKYLGFPVKHVKLDLDELQSLDLKVIVEHKVRQAYEKIKSPVIVEDVSLEFEGLRGLPGPFIKFFREKLSSEELCSLVNGKSRGVVARTVYGYFDGGEVVLFEGVLNGVVADKPAGNGGFGAIGWDDIFIPVGYEKTRAEISADDYEKTSLQLRPFGDLKAFLESLP
jgi:non-canonical purine NTP pyrophosphatase (RdgB/HAM1 family)